LELATYPTWIETSVKFLSFATEASESDEARQADRQMTHPFGEVKRQAHVVLDNSLGLVLKNHHSKYRTTI